MLLLECCLPVHRASDQSDCTRDRIRTHLMKQLQPRTTAVFPQAACSSLSQHHTVRVTTVTFSTKATSFPHNCVVTVVDFQQASKNCGHHLLLLKWRSMRTKKQRQHQPVVSHFTRIASSVRKRPVRLLLLLSTRYGRWLDTC